MRKRLFYLVVLSVAALVMISLATGLWGETSLAQAPPSDAQAASGERIEVTNAITSTLVLSYGAKFVCTDAIPAGTTWYGNTAPISQQQTEVLIHNPNDYLVTFYMKAVLATGATPGDFQQVDLLPDQALRLNCHNIILNLLNMPGTPPPGVTLEGFVVIEIGPQTNAAGEIRYTSLDVTAEYVRSTEVLKKDIHYQPWWRYWWWTLPWKLGYPYERLIQVAQPTAYYDCRNLLYQQLHLDVDEDPADPYAPLTHAALTEGEALYGPPMGPPIAEANPALAVIIGNCVKYIDPTGALYLDVDYVILSNKGPTDPDPSGTQQPDAILPYPWIPGRWHDTPVVIPQNVNIDFDDFFYEWQAHSWATYAQQPVDTIYPYMPYFFPYWCGWNSWWWAYNGGDCIDIAVGAGDSLDVEQVTPLRVIMDVWPPPLLSP